MRCRHCNYSLWNIAARQCPECGSAFLPTDYEFVPATIAFCCPHCDRVYVASHASGHLDPPRFECDHCHASVHENEMVLRVAEGAEEKDTGPGPMPWLERAHLGRPRALVRTVGLALVRPHRLIRAVPVSASVGESLAYAVLTTTIVLLFGAAVPWTVWAFALNGYFGASVLWFTWWIPLVGAAVFGAILLWALVTHLVLRVTGGCRHGVDRTLQAFAYGTGANALSAVPCVGPYVGWVWWIISVTVMVAVGQQVRAGRAVAAVLAGPLAVGLLVTASIVGTMVPWMQGFGGASGWSPATAATMSLANSIETSAWQSPAGEFEHILTMYVGGTLYYDMGTGQSVFCDANSKTTPADIPVGDLTLEAVDALPTPEKFAAAAQFLTSRPEEDTVAYRFGDFVFAYPGVSLTPSDPDVWLVVMLPDPDVNGLPAAGDPVYIASGQYTVVETTFGALPGLLGEQNAYRKTLELPPLPPLETVTHAAPALAPPDP